MLTAQDIQQFAQGPSLLHAFFYGFVASTAAELALFIKSFGPRGAIADKKYTTRMYWAVRFGLAFCAGVICTAAYNPTLNNFVYVYLGIAMPGLLSRGAEQTGPGDDSEP